MMKGLGTCLSQNALIKNCTIRKNPKNLKRENSLDIIDMENTRYRLGDNLIIKVDDSKNVYAKVSYVYHTSSGVHYKCIFRTNEQDMSIWFDTTFDETGREILKISDSVSLEYGSRIGLPEELIIEMLEEQERQGNPRNIQVFGNKPYVCKDEGGFDFDNALLGYDFWCQVITIITSYRGFHMQMFSELDAVTKLKISELIEKARLANKRLTNIQRTECVHVESLESNTRKFFKKY